MDADSNDDINLRSDSYWIAHAIGKCGHCRAATRLIALALPPGHQSLTPEWNVHTDEFVGDVWESASASAFLFYVEYLSTPVQRRLGEFSRSYRLACSDPTHGPYWSNHCDSCGAAMHDHELFCEPDGAFLPATPANASAVKLVRITEPLEAGAAGYAGEPQFFESMVAS
jgi:hypothetical protein